MSMVRGALRSPLPAQLVFDPLRLGKELLRLERGACREHEVQEIRLVEAPDRRRSVNAGDGLDLGDLRERAQRTAQIRLPVAEIRPHPK